MRPSRMPRIRLGCLGDEGSFRFQEDFAGQVLSPRKANPILSSETDTKSLRFPFPMGA